VAELRNLGVVAEAPTECPRGPLRLEWPVSVTKMSH
jgi:hypothetical protein